MIKRMPQVDYMKHTDNFAKTSGVESILIRGKPDLCPEPYLSIVIPTYKRPGFLKIALDSALGQTEPGISYEVIVVDNEPSGPLVSETAELISQYTDPNLLYYQNAENLGIAGNWNRCILLARGVWVAFLHDDDILLPDYIGKVRKLLKKKKDAKGIMTLSYFLLEGDGLQEADAHRSASALSRLYDRLSPNKLMRLRQTDSHFKLSNVYGPPTCGSIFCKDSMVKSGGFDDLFHPSFDWFFLYRFCKEHELYRSMERLGYYRIFVNESLSDKTKAAFLRDRITFAEYASKNSRVGRLLRRWFSNEQNNVILNEEYSDYAGKAAGDYFRPSEIRVRKPRRLLYRMITQGYWHSKSILSLIFG